MRQRLAGHMDVRPSDRDHVRARAMTRDRFEVVIFFMVLALLALLASPAAAQSRSAVQVAARVVSTSPSRDALILSHRAPGLFRTSLARVRVLPAAPKAELEPRRRQVQIDFLRN